MAAIIIQKVQEQLQRVGVENPPVPITELVEIEGLSWRITNFGDESADILGYLEPTERTIYVNQEDSQNRQAVTLAYCLGLHLLHPDKILKDKQLRICPRYPLQKLLAFPIPKDAVQFAEHLLIPDELLAVYTPLVQQQLVSKQQLATLFGVTQELLNVKMEDHG